jgi:hypothetical protein
MTETSWNVVVLYFGYVESSFVSPMIFLDEGGVHPTKLDALRGVATWLLRKWLEDHDRGLQWKDGVVSCKPLSSVGCCVEAPVGAKFCHKCGSYLVSIRFHRESFKDWILGRLRLEDAANFGWDGDGGREPSWTPWTTMESVLSELRHGRAVEVEERAEEVLIYAIDPDDLPHWMPADVTEVLRADRELTVKYETHKTGKPTSIDEILHRVARDVGGA